MHWEIILSILATVFGTGGIGASVKSLLNSAKNKKETEQALQKIELNLIEIKTSLDLIIKFQMTNNNKNELTINKTRRERKNEKN